jgi:putative tributyrin esterase
MQEVFEYTHKWLNFSKDKSKNFIAGLSMGGYMAINLALRYPDHFSYVGAFSPVVDLSIMYTDKKPDLSNPFASVLYGVFGGIDMNTSDLNIINQALAKKPFPRLYLYCGNKDGLYPGSKKLYNLLKEYNQDVEFYEDDGDHTWDRWETQLQRFLERM